MTVLCVIGCDPGPVPGIAVAYWDGDSWCYPAAYQCSASAAPALVSWLAEKNKRLRLFGAVEEFRTGTGAGARGGEASVTRRLVQDVAGALSAHKVPVKVRPAAAAKPWATDKRLERAGLIAVTAQLPHARDAMRHALFCAVHDGGVPDPLSAAARRGTATGWQAQVKVVPDNLKGLVHE